MSKLRTAAVLSLSTSAGVKAHNDPHKSRLKLRGRTLRNFISERSVDDSKQNSLQSSLERELQTGTECENNKWHPDDKTADGCSNSLEYPAEWEGVDALFFRNAQDCCQFFLPDKDCQIYNVCGGTTQTPSDESPVATSSCMWHPDVVNKDGCSNSPDVPIEWKSDAVYDSYNFASSEECCDKFFGTKPCVVHDECKEGTAPLSSPSTSNESPVAPSSSCNSNKWHPDDVNKDGCTNSPDFPQQWLREPSMFFYDTVEGCCDFFFSNCKIYDICVEEKPTLTSSTPKPSLTPTRKSQPTPDGSTLASSSCLWHPDMLNQDGCSNTLDYPEDWKGQALYFYDTPKECCDFFFPDGGCKVYYECEEQAPTSTEPSLKPTPFANQPTAKPTNVPSKQPTTGKPTKSPTLKPTLSPTTARPTKSPTPLPTQAPTSAPTGGYYANSSTGLCARVDATTPAWITTFYSDWTECCKAGWRVEACLAAAPPDAIVSSETIIGPSTNPTVTPFLYYAIPSSGMCIPVDASTPSWMTRADFFVDYEKCCQSSWNVAACIAAKPAGACCTLSPTPLPSSNPTSKPSSRPSAPPMPTPTCNSALWHPSEDFSKCTNGFGYNESWDSFPMNKIYMHETLSGCCEAFFEQWNNACVVEDVCDTISLDNPGVTSIPTKAPLAANVLTNQLVETQSPLSPPAPVPSSKPTSKPSTYTLPKCDSALWHPSEDLSKCSNSFGYPETWDDPAMSFAYLHDTAGGCCEMFFFSWGKECVIEDICTASKSPTAQPTGKPTTSPTKSSLPSCNSAKWHPSEDFSKCTNSFDYPSNWNQPALSAAYLHETADSCCSMFFFPWNKPCVLRDICSSGSEAPVTKNPTRSPTSRPTGQPSSSSPTGQPIAPTQSPTIYPTTSIPSQAPSKNPVTSKPTSTAPSKAPMTAKPTSLPTYSPTLRPTAAQYYSKLSDGMCATVDKDTPSYITTYYTEWSECCKVGWVYENCLAAAPPGAMELLTSEVTTTTTSSIMSTSTSTTSTKTSYWSSPSNGMCATVDKDTPSWITTFYNDWTECCKVGWVFDKCLAAAPTGALPTTTTTSTTTTTTCQSGLWHPTNDSTPVCTNSKSYPKLWDNPDWSDEYLLQTAQECCDNFYSGRGCEIVDICE